MKSDACSASTNEKEFAVTIENACTIHCTKQSHVLNLSLTGFLANSVEDEGHFTSVALSKAN